jgi:hypothetical protein
MKTIVFIICLTASFWTWMIKEYNSTKEIGYSPEHRAELQNKVDGLVPLSLADLGDL